MAVEGGVLLFGDEASFWLDGTLHRTWSPVGVQPRMPTYGLRKTAHLFGALDVEAARLTFQFAPVFNGHTFHEFLQLLVSKYPERKVFLVIDNGPCHWLDAAGKAWLAAHGDRIELHRLPPYSPEYNPIEGVWKKVRELATHNRFYPSIAQRDAALHATFTLLQQQPSLIEGLVLRFRQVGTVSTWMCLVARWSRVRSAT